MKSKVLKKSLSFTICILSIILVFSSLLSYKTSLEWLIKVSAEHILDAEIKNIEAKSNWHPFMPTIKVKKIEINFNANSPIKYLNLDELDLNLIISNFFQFSPFLEIRAEKGEITLNPEMGINNANSLSFIRYFSYIDIREIGIKNQNQLVLKRFSFNHQNIFYIEALEGSGGTLVISSNKAEALDTSNYLEGYLEVNDFNLESISDLININLSGKLNVKSWINLIGGDLTFLEGFFSIKEANIFSEQDRIKGLIRLVEGYEKPYLSFTNLELNTNNQKFDIPSTFASLDEQGLEINIPKILAGKKTLTEKVSALDFISFKGSLEDVFIKFEEKGPKISANFRDISVIDKKRKFTIEGINGQGVFRRDIAILSLDSPRIYVSTQSFFKDNFSITEVAGNVALYFSRDSLKYYSKDFTFRKEGEALQGKFSHYISETINDLSISINTTENNVENLKVFFPTSPSTKDIRNFVSTSLTCGKLRKSSLLYRGNLNNSSSSTENFQMLFNFADGCLSIPGYELTNISLFGTLSTTNLDAEIKSSNFYDSNLKASLLLSTHEDSNIFSVSGSFEGPLETYFRLIDQNLEYKDSMKNIKGFQKTKFNLSGDLFDFLDTKTSQLDKIHFSLYSRITNGSLDLEFPNFKIDDLNSTLNFDSKKGITNSFVDLNLNSEALRFKASGSTENLLLESRATINTKKITDSFNLDFLDPKGKSNYLIKISIPLRGDKATSLHASSNLRGTDFYVIKDFEKEKNQEMQFDLNSKLRKDNLNFEIKLGELLQGNLRILQEDVTGVFVINPRLGIKDNLSEKLGKLKITGTLNELDFGTVFDGEKNTSIKIPSNIDIDNLQIKKTTLGSLDLDEVSIDLINQDEYIFINLNGQKIKGDVYLSKHLSSGLILSLDYLIFSSSGEFGDLNWESFPKSLNFPLIFYSKEIVINNEYYGPWSFDISLNKEVISFEDISGSYGGFRVGNRISFPEFYPDLNPFIEDRRVKTKKINQSIEQGGWSIPARTNLEFFRNKRDNSSRFSGMISTNNLSDSLGLEYSDYKVQAGDFFLLLDVKWEGSPDKIDLDELRGKAEFRLKDLFIPRESEEMSEIDILRLIRVFNIADIFGNLTDLFSRRFEKGFSSDRVEAFINLSPNKLETTKPMTFKSSSGEFKWDGYVLRDASGKFTEIDFNVVMTLPLRDYLPAYALILGGPLSAVGVYIAGRTFKRPLNKLSSGKWRVWGDLDEIKAEFVEWFE